MLRAHSLWAKGAAIILLASLGFSCAGDETNDGIVPVSLVRLIISPDEVSGKRVRTMGFLQNRPTLRLFLTMDHAISLDGMSSVNISDDSSDGSLSQSNCLDHYVQVTGRFDRLLGVAWAIVDTEEIMRTDTGEICWQRQ